MQRREYLIVSGGPIGAALAGCSEPEQQEGTPEEESETTPVPETEPSPADASDTGSDTEVTIENISTESVSEQDLSALPPVEQTKELLVEVEYSGDPTDGTEATAELGTDETTSATTTEAVTPGESSVTLSLTSIEDLSGTQTLSVRLDDQNESDTFETTVELTRELTDRERWEGTYEKSIEHLEAALEIQGKQAAYDGSDATIMYVFPSMEPDVEAADDEIDEARRWEDRAWDIQPRLADDEFERTQELAENISLVEDVIQCQVYLYDAFEVLEEEWDVWEDEGAEAGNRPVSSPVRDAETLYDEIEETIEEEDVIFELLDMKISQLEWQLDQMVLMQEGVDLLWRAVDVDIITLDQIRLARESFESVEEELENPASAAPEDATDEALLELAEDWRKEAEEIERAII